MCRAKQAGHTHATETRSDCLRRNPCTKGAVHTRSLLVLGATAVIRHAKPGKSSPWLLSLLARKPRKVVAVALANKMARIAWAMMARGESYRQPIAA